ncbi:efflux transporter outer membrane subunit [Pseudomonas sp. PDM23]|uniref:efflux transporter outer membrane subunit n=1 Tax=unclassified Pseudomonas TaxID=196821 RepID=UPI0017850FC2|nr:MULTISPECIES: efflux transporter outer membrane subunit [unclassified Pseudomonas]MBD9578300.1 efflux transporter outer membrane subunit [Pseudomonas sp. PDM23]MBD9673499.1 efflux transporter outer membrane subunit [Pseudomonas sp. PDM21]
MNRTYRLVSFALLGTGLAGCAVGPDYEAPRTQAPASWQAAHSGDAQLHPAQGDVHLSEDWWTLFNDPVLNNLQRRADKASPDLNSAVLRFAQSRMQRQMVAAQRGVDVNASGGVTRQRMSENGANALMIQRIAPGASSDEISKVLAQPFTLYQAGFDASWEPDLWGRVSRSIEAADASVAAQLAMFEETRLGVSAELARAYFELRGVQQQIAVANQDIVATEQSLQLIQVRADGGLVDDFDVERQRGQLADLRSSLPQLHASESAAINQIGVLIGAEPGSLRDDLKPVAQTTAQTPDLSLGLPSEVARRRPDIRAAEAQLHAATANIGVAVADLYPSIRLGASFGYESADDGKFSDWGSRTWSVGPSLSLPIFDNGRRRSQINLRKLEQQEAAVSYQQTVLKAWQEVDDALTHYGAERQRNQRLQEKLHSSDVAYGMAKARYAGGMTDFLVELDAQRAFLQSRRDMVDSDTQLRLTLIALCKALGGGTPAPEASASR